MRASLVEIFSSFQGEGTYVGAPTIFVRFGGCDLRCRWCDSPTTWTASRSCRIERRAGSGDFDTVANPVEIDTVVDRVRGLGLRDASFVSATGGEPLLQPGAVAALGHALRDDPARFWLETHGLHVDALRRVAGVVDVVSMDWKLPGEVERASGAAGGFADAHRVFLEVALGSAECLVKIVVTEATRDEEWDEACRGVASVAPEVPFIVQPVTPVENPLGRIERRPSAARLMELQRAAELHLRTVRIIPQTHPLLEAL